jgi:hypothetical protein
MVYFCGRRSRQRSAIQPFLDLDGLLAAQGETSGEAVASDKLSLRPQQV